MADELHAAAGSPDKRVVKIEGGTHSGSSRSGGTAYRDAVLEFVRRAGTTTTADSAR
jgi:NAD-dependent SIR2 family protein deacetylase